MPSVRHDAPRIWLGFLPVLAATVLPLVGVVWFGLDSETLVAVYALELLIPECCDPFVETSEYNGEYVSPLLWITVVRAWCGCIRWRMEMLAGGVVIWVAVPAALPRVARSDFERDRAWFSLRHRHLQHGGRF